MKFQKRFEEYQKKKAREQQMRRIKPEEKTVKFLIERYLFGEHSDRRE